MIDRCRGLAIFLIHSFKVKLVLSSQLEDLRRLLPPAFFFLTVVVGLYIFCDRDDSFEWGRGLVEKKGKMKPSKSNHIHPRLLRNWRDLSLRHIHPDVVS